MIHEQTSFKIDFLLIEEAMRMKEKSEKQPQPSKMGLKATAVKSSCGIDKHPEDVVECFLPRWYLEPLEGKSDF